MWMLLSIEKYFVKFITFYLQNIYNNDDLLLEKLTSRNFFYKNRENGAKNSFCNFHNVKVKEFPLRHIV